MTKKINIVALCAIMLAISPLGAMEQFSSTVERIKDYSPYLVVPAFNIAQYKYRQTITPEQRYLPTVPAYFAPTAASVIASALLNRDLGWSNAFGWSLFKHIPAWLSSVVCAYQEKNNDNIVEKRVLQERQNVKEDLGEIDYPIAIGEHTKLVQRPMVETPYTTHLGKRYPDLYLPMQRQQEGQQYPTQLPMALQLKDLIRTDENLNRFANRPPVLAIEYIP